MRKEFIHIWNFPVKKIYVLIKKDYRTSLISKALLIAQNFSTKGRKHTKLAVWLNEQAKKYELIKKLILVIFNYG
jgi:hypothetical protein